MHSGFSLHLQFSTQLRRFAGTPRVMNKLLCICSFICALPGPDIHAQYIDELYTRALLKTIRAGMHRNEVDKILPLSSIFQITCGPYIQIVGYRLDLKCSVCVAYELSPEVRIIDAPFAKIIGEPVLRLASRLSSPALSAPSEATDKLPFLVAVPGRPGFYTCPGEPPFNPDGWSCWVDCRQYAAGIVIQSPYTGRHYRIPLDHMRQPSDRQ